MQALPCIARLCSRNLQHCDVRAPVNTSSEADPQLSHPKAAQAALAQLRAGPLCRSDMPSHCAARCQPHALVGDASSVVRGNARNCACTRVGSWHVRMLNQPTIHSQVLQATAFKCGKQGTRECMQTRGENAQATCEFGLAGRSFIRFLELGQTCIPWRY